MYQETEEINRTGILIKTDGNVKTVHLEGDIKQALREELGGKISIVRSSDQYFWVYSTNSFLDRKNGGLNATASYYSGYVIYGDCIVIPKTEEQYEGFSYREAVMIANNFNFEIEPRYDGVPTF